MDAPLLTWGLAGCVVGLLASALPGLHLNTVAALLLAAPLVAGETGAAFLVCAFAASPFGAALPAVFLGGSSEEGALASLPARLLAREGRGREAVALLAWGAFAGILLALALAALAWPAWSWLAPRLGVALPWLLVLVVVLLVASERARPPTRRVRVAVPWSLEGEVLRGRYRAGRVGAVPVEDPHGLLEGAEGTEVEVRVCREWRRGPLSPWVGRALALLMLAVAGALGLVALPLGIRSPLGLPGSVLLPLLAGLFALPDLLASLRAPARRHAAGLRARAPPRFLRAALPAATASALLGIAPGVSASHAALLTPRHAEPERRLVAMGALSGGAVVFTLLAWHALGKARAGALVVAQAFAPPTPWRTWTPPTDLLQEAALVVASAALACLLARGLAGPASRAPPRPLALVGLGLLLAAVVAFTGWLGLVILGVAGLVGALPGRLGVRRSHAMGVILVPALLRAWGF